MHETIRKYPNFHLSSLSHASKIVFNEKKEAIAVEFIRGGEKYSVKANKEIVLSAGAIGSPQLLMLSGIGPEETLKRFHIPIVSILPVGKNLQDHPTIQLEYRSTHHGLRQDELEAVYYTIDFHLNKKNYLTSSPIQGTAFIKTSSFTVI